MRNLMPPAGLAGLVPLVNIINNNYKILYAGIYYTKGWYNLAVKCTLLLLQSSTFILNDYYL